MITKILNWMFSPTKKPINEAHINFYEEILSLHKRLDYLEEQLMETSTLLNEMSKTMEALDLRIDMIVAEEFLNDISESNEL